MRDEVSCSDIVGLFVLLRRAMAAASLLFIRLFLFKVLSPWNKGENYHKDWKYWETLAGIILKLEQDGFSIHQWVQKMQTEWQSVDPDQTTVWSRFAVFIHTYLSLCLGWSDSSLSAWRKLGSLATHWAHSEDSDQTGQMPRLTRVFVGCCHFVGFIMRRLVYVYLSRPVILL